MEGDPRSWERVGGHSPAQSPHISSPFSKPQPHTWYWWVSIFTAQLRSRKVPNYGPVVWKSSVQPWMSDTIPFEASLWSQAALAFRGSYEWLSIRLPARTVPLGYLEGKAGTLSNSVTSFWKSEGSWRILYLLTSKRELWRMINIKNLCKMSTASFSSPGLSPSLVTSFCLTFGLYIN